MNEFIYSIKCRKMLLWYFLIVAVIPPTYFPATADSQQIPFNGENRMPSISQYERVSNVNETNEIFSPFGHFNSIDPALVESIPSSHTNRTQNTANNNFHASNQSPQYAFQSPKYRFLNTAQSTHSSPMYAQLNSVSNEFIGKNANFYQSPIQISNLCINNSPSNTPKRKKMRMGE